VRLHSSEIAVVTGRTEDPHGPRVAIVTSRRAEALEQPLECEATGIARGIAAAVDPRAVKVRVDADRLYGQA
jgi:hypothetical protein